jgi:hypothetical protein
VLFTADVSHTPLSLVFTWYVLSRLIHDLDETNPSLRSQVAIVSQLEAEIRLSGVCKDVTGSPARVHSRQTRTRTTKHRTLEGYHDGSILHSNTAFCPLVDDEARHN